MIATPEMPAVEVERISKRYAGLWRGRARAGEPSETNALQDVSFSVREGETLGLLGANGAGKTTLLKIMTALIHPNAGRVLLFGRDVITHAKWALGRIGLVTCDERSFYSRLSGRRNLVFFGSLYGIRGRELTVRADELLDALGLTYAAHRPYQTYSSGMKQKLAIARGLLADPRVIFYDEPTRSLDPVSTQAIRSWIAERRHNAPCQTHIIATNQLSEAEQLCDRVLILRNGRMVAHGTIREIRARYRANDAEVYRLTYRGPPPDVLFQPDPEIGLLEVRQEPAEPPTATLRIQISPGGEALSQILNRLLAAGGVLVRCEPETVSFDDVFFSLVLDDSADATRPDLAPFVGR